MIDTPLLTRTGEYVTTVAVPPFALPAEIISWGLRFFVRQPDGEYREALVWSSAEDPR
jgi:hypothetical protein